MSSDGTLRAAVAGVAGLTADEGALAGDVASGADPQLAAGLARLLGPAAAGSHRTLAGVCVPSGWPIWHADGTVTAWWDPASVPVHSPQRTVCGVRLARKLDGDAPAYVRRLVPSLVVHRDTGRLYLLDGHHSLALLATARANGLLDPDAPIGVYVHLAVHLGSTPPPQLDCDCPPRAADPSPSVRGPSAETGQTAGSHATSVSVREPAASTHGPA